MPSLLLLVFLLQLLIHLANTIGYNAINELFWNFYIRLPTSSNSKNLAEQKKLQTEYLRLRTELNGISAQDEFARWAKVKRQRDKAQEDLEKINQTILTTRSRFDTGVTVVRSAITSWWGIPVLLQCWYWKEAMFYLPKGFLPYYGEWLLSFPKAPTGSVSIQVWRMACVAVIELLSDAVVAAWVLVFKGSKGKMAMGAGAGTEGEEKKEI